MERRTGSWTISDLSGVHSITIGRRLPPGTTLDPLCARVVEIIQATARERGELLG